jgi:flavin-dependent dehydrogenase
MSSLARNLDFEVVVIGGGPAGSTASTLIAQQGYRVVLFERERFPRFHIGESLIPETYWVLKRLGMLEKLKQSHFVVCEIKRIEKVVDLMLLELRIGQVVM